MAGILASCFQPILPTIGKDYMMSDDLLIVPPKGESGIMLIGNAISTAIDKLLDDAIARCPDAASERDAIRQELIYAIHDRGSLPESIDLFKRKVSQ
jgi:hypothetical protein